MRMVIRRLVRIWDSEGGDKWMVVVLVGVTGRCSKWSSRRVVISVELIKMSVK